MSVLVLVVDDDIDARELLERVLGDQGAAVLTASSTPDGLIAIEHFRPAVVVSDLAMPGMDGYEFMRAIRALPAERGGDVAGIALSAYGRAEDSNDAFAAGFMAGMLRGFSVSFMLAALGFGVIDLMLSRERAGLLKRMALINIVWLAAMTTVSLRYFFIVPTSFLATTLLIFMLAWLKLPADGTLQRG